MRSPRPSGTPLVWHPNGLGGAFAATLPAGAAGRWCSLAVRVPGHAAWWAKLEVTDPSRDQIVRETFLGPRRASGGRGTLIHLPNSCDALLLRVFSSVSLHAAPEGILRPLSRAAAAFALLRHGWRLVPGALAGSAMGRLGRLRVTLGQAPARAGEAPDYTIWCALHDRWGEAERTALLEACGPAAPGIGVLVVGAEGRAASLASVAQQWRPPVSVQCVAEATRLADSGAAWTLVLRAGDTLVPHALACLALEAGRRPGAELIFADIDVLGPCGRGSPLFKPAADMGLLRAGVTTSGACLLPGHVPPASAAFCRPERARGVPFVLTHLASPPKVATASDRLHGTGWPFVSIVVPTSGRSRHMWRCLRRLLAATRYEGGFEVLLAVSRTRRAHRGLAARLARAARLPGVRLVHIDMPRFNYAAVNNRAVELARGPLVLLLNDDVAPIRPDWLSRMVAIHSHAGGEAAGIVGARLLYGNGQVQHGGVIMGLAHLCEHAFRLARHDDPGPHGLALLDREVSAVTGACLLVGRDLYKSLGGMDESFAIALNDVDFCARARQAGVRIVFAASVLLHHYEGMSLGRHYAGTRAVLESHEVRRLRERWAPLIARDPFYHPCASLEPGREFQPGFPPRITPLSWIAGDHRAQV